jgi:histidinol-phosphatase (PHP family)
MKFDLHTHHDRCGHAVGSIRDYIEAAIHGGLQMIGISDHSPYFYSEEDRANPRMAMAKSQFSAYIEEVLQLKREYSGKIDVLLGVESDYFPEHQELYRQIYAALPLDYLIGSVHILNGLHLTNKARWQMKTDREILRENEQYLGLIQQSVQSRMFDILGHIDALKSHFPDLPRFQTPLLEQTVKIIAEHDGVIEVNTSGKRKACGDWYPSHDILELACFHGVKVTYGSDAHAPERVAEEWEAVTATLKDIGFKQWVWFKDRKRQTLTL